MKRVICLLMVAAMLLTVLVGCSGGNSGSESPGTQSGESKTSQGTSSGGQASVTNESFTIKVNTNQKSDSELKQLNEAIKRFNEKYPNAVVELDTGVDTGDWSEYAQRLLTQIASGERPDIIWMAVEGIRFLADNECIAPLDDYIANNEDLKAQLDDVDPMITKCFEYNNKLWAIPLGWNNCMIIYNTKVFEEAGVEPNPEWTWDEFVDTAKKLTVSEGSNQRWGFAMGPYLSNYQIFMVNNDAYNMNETWDESRWAEPNTIETMQFMYDLINKHKVMPIPEFNVNYIDMFMAGRIAMTTSGAWNIKSFKEKGFTDYDFIPVPINKTEGTSYGADGYALVKGSDHPEAAVDMIKELTGPEIQNLIAELGTSVPASRTAAYSEAFLSSSPNAYIMYESLKWDNVRIIPSPTFYPEMNDSFTRHWGAALSGEKTVEQAMLDIDKDTKELIAKTK